MNENYQKQWSYPKMFECSMHVAHYCAYSIQVFTFRKYFTTKTNLSKKKLDVACVQRYSSFWAALETILQRLLTKNSQKNQQRETLPVAISQSDFHCMFLLVSRCSNKHIKNMAKAVNKRRSTQIILFIAVIIITMM